MPELQVHPEVKYDLAEIYVYIAQDDSDAAEAVELAVTDAFKLLARHPRLGTEYSPLRRTLKGIRMMVVTEYPNYLIYYRPLPEDAGVRILYVLHAARDAVTVAKDHRRQ